MAKTVFLVDIRGKMHVFECPPWHVVQVKANLYGSSVHLSSGDGTGTVQMSEEPDKVWMRFKD